ncbi:MAG TPA: chemotaxis response regulator protein-glutamate methylesterase [Terriglobales bacterium]|jgi:two-component system chemotaxis response regulator CheB
MGPIRVLIVDDSVVIRKILTEELSTDPSIAVVGSASSGQIALAKILQVNPDIVTLDIEMPGMNGLETLKHIRHSYPKLPVIMFSTLTELGASATLEALSLGASDYLTKPSNAGSVTGARNAIRRDLIHKLKSLTNKPTVTTSFTKITPNICPRRQAAIEIVAIGTSTGGPNALAEVLPRLPQDFPVPILVVQHMPPLFTRLLAERLNAQSGLSIREAETGRSIAPGEVWMARGDYHMTVVRHNGHVLLSLNQELPENFCRPAVDVLFRSVAHTYGASTLAVVMTGMGSDGARGACEIRDAGGAVLVQDQDSSVVWGMPGAVANAGAVDKICPLKQLSQEIVERVNTSRAQGTAIHYLS